MVTETDKKQVSYRLEEKLLERLRKEAFQRNVDMVVVVSEALAAHFSAQAGTAPIKSAQPVRQKTTRPDSTNTEPAEWADLAAVASQVTGRIHRSMYRSIRFQLEYLALMAKEQGIEAPNITIRYDDDGRLVVPVKDTRSPLRAGEGDTRPGQPGAGDHGADAGAATPPVPKRRKA